MWEDEGEFVVRGKALGGDGIEGNLLDWERFYGHVFVSVARRWWARASQDKRGSISACIED